MDIYEPAEDSYLLQRAVKERAWGRVLDMGTGSGIEALGAITRPAVREVVAVDINPDAVARLQEKVCEKKLRKIKVLRSDLFEQVEGSFNTIIFNPPYLPQDKGIEDTTLYGGKKGWELVGRFLKDVARYLFPDGEVLLLFSSLTKKDKIEALIARQLLLWKELAREKVAFEELYVYSLTKSKLLLELERKGIAEQFEVTSCGVCARDGGSAAMESLLTLKNDEITLTDFKTRLCRREDVLSADLIIGMSEEHRKFISDLCPPARDRIVILGVPDPVGMSIDFYEKSYQIIKEKLLGIWPQIIA